MIVMAVMQQYYSTWFEADLADFMGSRPHPYFGHAWNSNCAGMLARVDEQRRPFFLVCLYFTVLVDQAIYTYYRPKYSRFAALTAYPKFCHGLSQFQLNPREIMLTPVDQGIVSDEHMRTLLPAGMTLFVEEVTSFCRDHMQDIDPAELFEKLLGDSDVQIPSILVALDPKMELDVGWVGYKALRTAVEAAFPPGAR